MWEEIGHLESRRRGLGKNKEQLVGHLDPQLLKAFYYTAGKGQEETPVPGSACSTRMAVSSWYRL